jgi:hypothetical protein
MEFTHESGTEEILGAPETRESETMADTGPAAA